MRFEEAVSECSSVSSPVQAERFSAMFEGRYHERHHKTEAHVMWQTLCLPRIKQLLNDLYARLDVANRTEAAAYVLREGLV